MRAILALLSGAMIVAGLSWLVHDRFGFGEAFVTRLESRAVSTLAHAGGAGTGVQVQRAPALARTVILHSEGSAPPSRTDRQAWRVAVGAVPGVRDVRWSDDAVAPPAGGLSLLAETMLTLMLFYTAGFAIGALLWRRRR